eukprot:TRINITY_DN36368_c0_g1_i1.p1 TRINITY_DN36368_c0_g1~~TRINITY_DN36368_c0_g1_i1.p1  ORF type:complete len:635 (+),score=164.93 TRINITY_DN36368_c0_g1_i1:41-1945(+)
MEGDYHRVQVFARARPLSPNEAATGAPFIEVDEFAHIVQARCETDACPGAVAETSGSDAAGRAFNFDGVFSAEASQQHVFTQAGLPVLQGCMQGFNGTILAYGQTGSGKTYSLLHQGLEGVRSGLLSRLVASLFSQVAQDIESVYEIEAAALQVYNEQVDDLLHPERENGLGFNLQVQNGGLVPGLTWERCARPDALLEAFARARSNLVYAETRMNKASSRSHAVFQVKITRHHRIETDAQGESGRQFECTTARLNVIDLAGSERVKKSGVEGAQLKEALAINKSLLVFGNVVSALAAKRVHVPFRESKLTRILDGSIGGNSRTSLLVCVSPALEHAAETLSALEFASRAMRVEVDARVNRVSLTSDVMEDSRAQVADMIDASLREEIANLKSSLQAERLRADEARQLQQASEARNQQLEKELAVARRGERELLRSSEAFEARAIAAESLAAEWQERAEAFTAELEEARQARDEALERAQRAEAELEEEMEALMTEVEASAERDLERQRESDTFMVAEQQRAIEGLRAAQVEAEEWKARTAALEEEVAELAAQLEQHRLSHPALPPGTERWHREPLQLLRQNRHSTATCRAASADGKVLQRERGGENDMPAVSLLREFNHEFLSKDKHASVTAC